MNSLWQDVRFGIRMLFKAPDITKVDPMVALRYE